MIDRRKFLELSALASAVGMGLGGCAASDLEPVASDSSKSLSILILGGTGFIGPHMVERALARGHSVTLFNRGKTNADRFPEVPTLIGDRNSELGALEGKRWDAVIDNSGYVPRHVQESADLLAGNADHYLFISTISVYADYKANGIEEDYPLGTMDDPTTEEVTGATYGPMKALCEKAVSNAFPEDSTIVRPGYIVGPEDRSDRWTYWPVRVNEGGIVLAPGTPTDPIQVIDARDLARFTIALLENQTTGIYNAVGPKEPVPMGDMLELMKSVTGSDASFEWVDAEQLQEMQVSLPIWAPANGEFSGVHRVSNARAHAAGLTHTPLENTIKDTFDWWQQLDEDRRAAMRSGLRVASDENALRPGPASLADQMAQEAKVLSELGLT